jgi:hypothetical protein
MTIDQPEQIQLFQLLTLRSALKLELLGMRHSRNAAWKSAKALTGARTRKEAVEILDGMIYALKK